MIPLHDLARQNTKFKPQFHNLLDEVVDESAFILRDHVDALEKEVMDLLHTQSDVIGVNSGTDALFLGLMAANMQPGDEVLVPSRTYVASISAICHLGLVPRFVDIGEDMTMSVEDLGKKVTRRTKAIMPVHLAGRPCNMAEIMEIAVANEMKVVEDAAPAIGARFGDKLVSTFGEAGAISLHPLKALSVMGDGGLLVCSDPLVAQDIRVYRDHCHQRPKHTETYVGFGINSRLDNFQAGVARLKMPELNEWIQRRRDIARRYSEVLLSGRLAPQAEAYLQAINDEEALLHTFSSYVLRVEHPDAFIAYMRSGANAVQVERCYGNPIHLQSALQDRFPAARLPRTEEFARHTVQIPIFPELLEEEVDRVCVKLKDYFVSHN